MMTPNPWIGLLFGLLLAAPLPVRAQEDSRERFELYTRCAAMGLAVDLQDDGDDLDGLTAGRIEQAVRSRLRAARLYRQVSDSDYLLSVYVHVARRAFSVDLDFYKPLYDPVSGRTWIAITSEESITGTHGTDANFVVSAVSQLMDGFLDDYLRVNEVACTNRDFR